MMVGRSAGCFFRACRGRVCAGHGRLVLHWWTVGRPAGCLSQSLGQGRLLACAPGHACSHGREPTWLAGAAPSISKPDSDSWNGIVWGGTHRGDEGLGQLCALVRELHRRVRDAVHTVQLRLACAAGQVARRRRGCWCGPRSPAATCLRGGSGGAQAEGVLVWSTQPSCGLPARRVRWRTGGGGVGVAPAAQLRLACAHTHMRLACAAGQVAHRLGGGRGAGAAQSPRRPAATHVHGMH